MDKAASLLGARSPRARRALTLMLLALLVVVATSVYYLRPRITFGTALPTAATAHTSLVQRRGDLVNYYFASAALGWAVEAADPGNIESGAYSLFKTVDAGRHWQRQLTGQTRYVWMTLYSLQFLDHFAGYFSASDPLALYRTRDGGAHWTKLDLPLPDVVSVQFTDRFRGWLLARSQAMPDQSVTLYETWDGGDTWTPAVNIPTSIAFFPTFRDALEGWSGASDPGLPSVYLTTDGGFTWERRYLPREPDLPQSVTTVVRLLPHRGTLVFEYGDVAGPYHVYTTDDEGRSWMTVNPPLPGLDIGGVMFADTSRWWSVQNLALYKTADGGRSWTRVANAPDGLGLIQVLDDRHAWAQLDEGSGMELLFTQDGGLNWTRTNVPIPQ